MKLYCTAPSNPLIKDIATTYNLTAKQAKAILNSARNEDPSLIADNVDFKYLKQNEAFKKALSTFKGTELEEKVIYNPDGAAESNREALKQEIRDALGESATEEKVDYILSKIDSNDADGYTYDHIRNTVDMHQDNNIKIYNTIGNFFSRNIIVSAYKVLNDNNFAAKHGFNTKYNSITDVITSREFREYIYNDTINRISEQEDCDSGMLDFILATCCKNDFYNFGVRVTPTGMLVPINYDPAKAEQNNEDGVDGIIEGDSTVRDYNESDNEKDNREKVSSNVKLMLATFTQGNDDILGLPKPINVNRAIDTLHSICCECNTVDEMIEMISLKKGTHDWMDKLCDALTLGNSKGFIDGMVMTDSEKEILREQFYKSMNLSFTPMATTTLNKKGNITTFTPNVNSLAARLSFSTLRNYNEGNVGVIYGGYVHHDEVKEVLDLLSTITDLSNNDSVTVVYEALKFIGINAGKNAIRASNDAALLRAVRQAYVTISKMSEIVDTEEVNLYTNPIIQILSQGTPDKKRIMARAGKKTFFSWLNPSMISTLTKKFNKKDLGKRQEYIDKTYGDSDWFVRATQKEGEKFYANELNAIYNGELNIEYREKPSVFGKSYNELSSADNIASMLTDFFGRRDRVTDMNPDISNTTWYRMFIASDKPRYLSVKMTRFGIDYKDMIFKQSFDFLEQEIRRAKDVLNTAINDNTARIDGYDIKRNADNKDILDKYARNEKITIDDVVKNGRYIFKGTGASFYLNKFLNNEIKQGTKLGREIVDAIFNTRGSDNLISVDLTRAFRERFHEYIESMAWGMFDLCLDNGLLSATTVKQLSDGLEEEVVVDAKNIENLLRAITPKEFTAEQTERIDYFKNEIISRMHLDYDGVTTMSNYLGKAALFMMSVEEYCYHNWYAKTNMSEIFGVDPALFGDTTNFQKRWAQIIASGESPNQDATIHGKQVSDGKLRSITIVTEKEMSGSLDNIRLAMEEQRDSITDAKRRVAFEKNMNTTLNELEKIDSTDGQAYTSLSGLRKKLSHLGAWSRSKNEKLDNLGYILRKDGTKKYLMTDEAVYQRWKRGKCVPEDFLHVFAQPQKPFASGFAKMTRNKKIFTYVFQHKNSEYALIPMAMYANKKKGIQPQSIEEAMAMFLEETENTKGVKGIDTINISSAVKVGNNSGAIYINKDMSPDDILDKLRKSVCFGELNNENPYKDDVVTEFDMDNYHIVANKPEHFKDSRTMQGSQMKVFTVTNIDNDEEIKISDEETTTAQQLREEYHNLLAKKIRMNTDKLSRRFGLHLPIDLRKQKLSDALLRIASNNNKTEAHEVMSYALKPENGDFRFYSPLDDPTIQSQTEASLYSQIRRAIYSGKVNGGSIVQASSFGSTKDLNIRFYSSNPKDSKYGGVVPTLKEYLRDNKGKNESDYRKYIKEYQGGYAYFECEVPMPNDIKKMLVKKSRKQITDFLDRNGNWNMEAINKIIDPKLLEMVCYRIPTESKYSIMACKVVRFSTEAGGSIAKYPADMITFTGSDFDIDTTYIERRDIISDTDSPNDKKEKELNNRLFDLHYAALRANGSLQEAFKNGDFSELSELSYKKVLLENGYIAESVNRMSKKQLQEACKDVEDLDLMSPVTDDILKSQNSEAKELIGISAVGNASHGLLSMLSENGKHITIHIKNEKDNENSFAQSSDEVKFINDKDVKNKTEFYFSGDINFDDIYDMDGHLISEKIGNYIGASTDAAKDAALSRLNINTITLPILIFMHRTGVSADVARLFIANPVVSEVCQRIKASGGTMSLNDAISDMRREIYMQVEADEVRLKQLKSIYSSKQTISYNTLFRDLENSYDNIGNPEKIKYLKVLSVMSKYSSKTKSLDNFARYTSSTAMKHSSFIDRYVALKRVMKVNELDAKTSIVKLPSNLRGTCAFDKLCNALPHVGEAIKAEAKLTEALILDNMHTYNSAFFNIIDRMFVGADYIENESVKLGMLRDAWRNRLLFVGANRIADFTDKRVFDKYVTNFANSFDARKREIEEEYGEGFLDKNALINAIDFKPITSNDGKSLTILDINNDDLRGHDLLALQEDWEALLEDDLTAEFAIDIAIHFLAQNVGFKAGSLSNAIPIKIKEAIPNYYKAFDDANKEVMTQEEEDKFYIDFVLNNMLMRDVTDYVYPISQKKKKKDEDGGKVVYEKDVYEVKIPIDLSSSRIETIKDANGVYKALRYNVPIIKMNGDIFKKNDVKTYGAVLLNNGEITDIEGKGNTLKGTVTVRLCEQKGIPGEIAEYTGNSKSYIENMDFEAAPQNLFDIEQVMSEPEEQNSDELSLGEAVNIMRESGLTVQMSPYDRMGVGIELDTNETSLVSSRMSRGNNAFEESRMFLSRMDKISSALGIKLSKANRNASSTDVSNDFYSFSVEQNDLQIPMRDQVKMLASVAVLLSEGSDKALVKEYVTDADHATNAELTIPITKNSKKEILEKVKEAGISKYYIKNGSELVVTVNRGTNGEFIKQIRDTTLKLLDLKSDKLKGLLGEKINVYYIRRNAIKFEDAVENLNNKELKNKFTNERENKEKVRTRSPYRAINRDSSRSADRQQERIRNIIDLAERRAGGEDITESLLNFYNEMPSRLSSASRSMMSAELVRNVRSETDGRFDSLLKKNEIDKEDVNDVVDNAIVNTANWLLSFKKSEVKEAMQKQGFREIDATKIINAINKQLDDLNIC